MASNTFRLLLSRKPNARKLLGLELVGSIQFIAFDIVSNDVLASKHRWKYRYNQNNRMCSLGTIYGTFPLDTIKSFRCVVLFSNIVPLDRNLNKWNKGHFSK